MLRIKNNSNFLDYSLTQLSNFEETELPVCHNIWHSELNANEENKYPINRKSVAKFLKNIRLKLIQYQRKEISIKIVKEMFVCFKIISSHLHLAIGLALCFWWCGISKSCYFINISYCDINTVKNKMWTLNSTSSNVVGCYWTLMPLNRNMRTP